MKYFSSGPFVASPMAKKVRKNVLSPQPTNLSDLLALASMGCESPGINDRSMNDINSPSGKGSSMRGEDSSMSKSLTKIGGRKKFIHKSNNNMKFKKKGLPTEYSTMLDGFVDQVTAENLINAKLSKKRTNKNIKH